MAQQPMEQRGYSIQAAFRSLFSYPGDFDQAFEQRLVGLANITCRDMVLSAISMSWRMMGSEASASPCCIRGRPHPGCPAASPSVTKVANYTSSLTKRSRPETDRTRCQA